MNYHTLAFYSRLAKLTDKHLTVFYSYIKDIVIYPCSTVSELGKNKHIH